MANGLLNILKPPGLTSSDVVVRCKKVFGEKRCGHMGTLDPAAAGVLLVGVGKTARLFDYLLQKDKAYRAVFSFGKETDTLDSCGRLTRVCDKPISKEEFCRTLGAFTGKIEQVPPAYSAIKVGGEKAYDLARSGRPAELKPRPVEIFSLTFLEELAPNVFELDIVCSAGTYIRALARDLARALGTVGNMDSLIRLRCGPFRLEDSLTEEEVARGAAEGRGLIPPEEVLADLPDWRPSQRDCFRLRNGLPAEAEADGLFRLWEGDRFVGLAEVREGRGKIRTLLEDGRSGPL